MGIICSGNVIVENFPEIKASISPNGYCVVQGEYIEENYIVDYLGNPNNGIFAKIAAIGNRNSNGYPTKAQINTLNSTAMTSGNIIPLEWYNNVIDLLKNYPFGIANNYNTSSTLSRDDIEAYKLKKYDIISEQQFHNLVLLINNMKINNAACDDCNGTCHTAQGCPCGGDYYMHGGCEICHSAG